MQLGWGSSLWEEGEDLMYAVGWFCFGKEGDCCNLGLLAAHLGKRKGHPPSLFACWISLIPISLLSYHRLVPILILS